MHAFQKKNFVNLTLMKIRNQFEENLVFLNAEKGDIFEEIMKMKNYLKIFISKSAKRKFENRTETN